MNKALIEECAKAMERQYHKESGGKWVCGNNQGECWKSMEPFVKTILRVVERHGGKKRRKKGK